MMLLEESEGKGEEKRRLRNYARKHFRTPSQNIKYVRFRLALSLVLCKYKVKPTTLLSCSFCGGSQENRTHAP